MGKAGAANAVLMVENGNVFALFDGNTRLVASLARVLGFTSPALGRLVAWLHRPALLFRPQDQAIPPYPVATAFTSGRLLHSKYYKNNSY